MKTHYGDPCIHCGVAHDSVPVGPCEGDTNKAIPLAFCSLGVRWDSVEHYRIRWSDGRITDEWNHISFRRPYFHFGKSSTIRNPPEYSISLRGHQP